MRALVAGQATGPVLALERPLSLWGGVDPTTGLIIEPSHPQHGESVTGKILSMPASRGSSSSSSVLAELLRAGKGPIGIVLGEPDSILVVGALVARHLYGVQCPVMAGSFGGRSGEIWAIDGEFVRQARPGR